jgi:hypothetical protein
VPDYFGGSRHEAKPLVLPHEITLDQLFSEEQFEVYRALGFHMVLGLLSGQHKVCVNVQTADGETKTELLHYTDPSNPTIGAVRSALAA